MRYRAGKDCCIRTVDQSSRAPGVQLWSMRRLLEYVAGYARTTASQADGQGRTEPAGVVSAVAGKIAQKLRIGSWGADMNSQPLVVAYGLGVDSTAALVGLHQRGIRPDLILFADTKSERVETYRYLPVIQQWLAKVGFPPVTVVNYQVSTFKHYPPYAGLEENCLTNGTLPSLAFGFKSCSLKWKVTPQNKFTDRWQPAIDCWAAGGRVRKIIGYDNSAKDRKRYSHAVGVEDPKYEYWYPLIEWGMDREACKELIRSADLPVPPKSACVFCPATQPAELHEFRKSYLRRIVIMEARAKPRLEGCMTQKELDLDYIRRLEAWYARVEKTHGLARSTIEACDNGRGIPGGFDTMDEFREFLEARPKRRFAGKGTAGLWRSATKTRPAMMTDYIRSEGLLPADEIQMLQERAPAEIIDNQQAFANGETIPDWHDFLEQFSPEDAVDEIACTGCITK